MEPTSEEAVVDAPTILDKSAARMARTVEVSTDVWPPDETDPWAVRSFSTESTTHPTAALAHGSTPASGPTASGLVRGDEAGGANSHGASDQPAAGTALWTSSLVESERAARERLKVSLKGMTSGWFDRPTPEAASSGSLSGPVTVQPATEDISSEETIKKHFPAYEAVFKRLPPGASTPRLGRTGTIAWQRMISRAIYRHRWAMQGMARRFSINMPRKLDHHPPVGLTLQGRRWGWREIRASW